MSLIIKHIQTTIYSSNNILLNTYYDIQDNKKNRQFHITNIIIYPHVNALVMC